MTDLTPRVGGRIASRAGRCRHARIVRKRQIGETGQLPIGWFQPQHMVPNRHLETIPR
jgi:hypothetical protein